ncbi:hypothetical protein [Alienimonas chondri]|uniref:Uncharacterized protein n=1 Tax=Alienimonas chondri TaxID=2681879 RepID=A0ABX1V9S9_9PLAN|nr:hypothetical protein [Alienimonas chondri]NNJ24652.1 hypothetical protein [Alienimonas chondri]
MAVSVLSGQTAGQEAGPGEGAAATHDLPADVRRVVEAWPSLPPAIRAGVLAMVEASGG